MLISIQTRPKISQAPQDRQDPRQTPVLLPLGRQHPGLRLQLDNSPLHLKSGADNLQTATPTEANKNLNAPLSAELAPLKALPVQRFPSITSLKEDSDQEAEQIGLLHKNSRRLPVNTLITSAIQKDHNKSATELSKYKELQRKQNLLATAGDPPLLDFAPYTSRIQARLSTASSGRLVGCKRRRPEESQSGVSEQILKLERKPLHPAYFSSTPSLNFDIKSRTPELSPLLGRGLQSGVAPVHLKPFPKYSLSFNQAPVKNITELYLKPKAPRDEQELQNLLNRKQSSRTCQAANANQNFEDQGSSFARLEDAQFKCQRHPQPMPQSVVLEPRMRAYLAEHFPKICSDWPVEIILGQHFDDHLLRPSDVEVPSSKQFLVFHFTKQKGKIDFRLFECLHHRNHFDRCYKKFSNLSKFYDHIRTHTKEKPFRCQFCGEGFGQKGNLVAHVSQRHLRDKRYPCSICGQEFSRKNNMRQHERSHDEQPSNEIRITDIPY